MRLSRSVLARTLTLHRRSDQRFIGLDMLSFALNRAARIGCGHEFPQFVTNAPCTFVGHTFLYGRMIGAAARLTTTSIEAATWTLARRKNNAPS
jgi:hypothetical protein